jgi:hypothetical protein
MTSPPLVKREQLGAKSPSGYVDSLYSAGGTLLGSVTMATKSGLVPGWATGCLHCSDPDCDEYQLRRSLLRTERRICGHVLRIDPDGIERAPLNAPGASPVGGNGVYCRRYAFPTRDYEHTKFFVDVAFLPARLPYLNLVMNPANPTIPSTTSLGAKVAQIAVTWSDGSPFTGTLSFGAPNFNSGGIYALDSNNNLIVSPLGPGVGSPGGSTENVTIVAIQ